MKRFSMLCISGVAALTAGLGIVLSVVASAGPSVGLRGPTVSAYEVTAPAAPMFGVRAPELLMPVDCLNAWSKDFCDGFMHPGDLVLAACPLPPCRTATVTNATWVVPVIRNLQLCAPDGKCDESPQTDGTLKMTTNYELRLNDPCPFRGCWSGKWELHTVTGAVFQGDAMGTLGVGTNRKFTCPVHRTQFCERCLDVEFIADAGLWRIAYEGAFQGKRVDAETGERLCFTVNGDWYLEGDANGPFDFSGNFKTYGTADGIHAVPCGF